MKDLIEKIKEKTNEIKKILPDRIEYYTADEIENKWNETTDLIAESLWDEFESGTDMETIWHWFDEQHSKGAAWLMNEYKP